MLDAVGFAASTAHRGVRFVRFAFNDPQPRGWWCRSEECRQFFWQKNWVGTFHVPDAVVNDFELIRSLPEAQKRAGFIEAVKVALIRDCSFYEFIEENFSLPSSRNWRWRKLSGAVQPYTCNILLHRVIPSKKVLPRPLDFGHWIAHKLEQVSNFEIGHGDAVAIGIVADLLYSAESGCLKMKQLSVLSDSLES